MGTPLLWSALMIGGPFTPFLYSQATQWLSRSKGIPKALVIDSSAECSWPSRCRDRCALGSAPLAALLAEGPGPLRYLSFICARSLCVEYLQRLLSQTPQTHGRRPWDTITTLHLEPQDFWNHYEQTDEIYDEHNSDYPILENLPLSVTRLSLFIPSLLEAEGADEDTLYILKLPGNVLARFTHFTFTCSMNATTILGVLASCREVQVLCLDLEWTPWSDPDEDQLNLDEDGDMLPALRNLRIKSCPSSAAQYLRAFRTPCLETFEIELDDSPAGGADKRYIGILEDYFHRSQCHSTVTHLQLQYACVKNLYPILANLTSLTHLALACMDPLSHQLFRDLAERHQLESTKPLPALKYISFTHVLDGFSHEPVWEWIHARRSSGMDELEIMVTEWGHARETLLDSKAYALGARSEVQLHGRQQRGVYREDGQLGLDQIFV